MGAGGVLSTWPGLTLRITERLAPSGAARHPLLTLSQATRCTAPGAWLPTVTFKPQQRGVQHRLPH